MKSPDQNEIAQRLMLRRVRFNLIWILHELKPGQKMFFRLEETGMHYLVPHAFTSAPEGELLGGGMVHLDDELSATLSKTAESFGKNVTLWFTQQDYGVCQA